jgi:hypothetical protein
MMSGAEEKNGMDAEEFQAYVVEDIEEVEAPQGHFAPIFAIAIPPAQQMHQLAVEVISKLDSMDTINRRISAFALPEGWIRIEVPTRNKIATHYMVSWRFGWILAKDCFLIFLKLPCVCLVVLQDLVR